MAATLGPTLRLSIENGWAAQLAPEAFGVLEVPSELVCSLIGCSILTYPASALKDLRDQVNDAAQLLTAGALELSDRIGEVHSPVRLDRLEVLIDPPLQEFAERSASTWQGPPAWETEHPTRDAELPSRVVPIPEIETLSLMKRSDCVGDLGLHAE